jgi:uncharacterized protein YciI
MCDGKVNITVCSPEFFRLLCNHLVAMFIINLTYIVPLEELDRHMNEHVKFLQKYYKENIFVASGRKVPRTGGIILALADSQKQVEQIIQEDPFYIHKLADFTITEFLTSQYHPQLTKLLKK